MSPTTEEPYVGLGHFTEDYADRFFGRDTECSLIIGNLRAARLTLLYAESGVGKSSVLRAGVVAQLHDFAERARRTRDSPRLVPVIFSSWTEAPVAGLIRAIGDATRPYLPDDRPLELPDDDLERALELASEALDATLLVVLDQFEEYFLYRDDQPEEKQVAAQIARCVNRPHLRANFLISIREDSYARLGDLFRGKVTDVYANFLHLDFLGRAGARESIEKPIERVNELSANGERYELEPALVEAVLDQVGRGRIEAADEDGHRGDGDERDEIETTYLQLVMRRLWEEETGAGSNRLRLRTLEQLGGSQAVITSHLDRAMDDETDGAKLSAEQRLVAASIFHFLVTSGGTKIALTAQDLADLSGRPPGEIEPVLRHLSSPALHILRPVVSENGQGEPRFEIFHDALARPIVEWRSRVEEAERDRSLARERAEKESAQKAAAAAEQKAIVERRRRRAAVALLVIFVAIAIVAAGIRLTKLANDRKATNQSLGAAQRMAELEESPTFGPAATALASIEAYDLWPTDEARNVTLSELQLNPGLPAIAVGHTRAVSEIAFWPDSSGFVTGGKDGTVRLWRANGSERGKPLVNPDGGSVESVACGELASGERIIAAGLSNGSIGVWKVAGSADPRLLGRFPMRSGAVGALAFDPRRPGVLAFAGSDGRVTLADLNDPRHPTVAIRQTGGRVSDLAFTANGRGLLVAGAAGGQEWRLAGSRFESSPPRPLASGAALSVAAGPGGSWAFGGLHGIHVWDAARTREGFMRVPQGTTGLAFARRGSVLVSGGADLNVVTWDLASGRPFGPPRIGNGPIADVAVSPDGRTIAAADEGRLVKLWPVEPQFALARTVGSLGSQEVGSALPDVADLAVTGNGLVAAAAGSAGTSLWRLGGGGSAESAPRPVAQLPGASYAVATHGDLLAVAQGRSFALEDTGCDTGPSEPCSLAFPLEPHSKGLVESLTFVEDGPHLLLASSGFREGKGLVNLWNVSKAEKGVVTHLKTIRKPTAIYQLAFSPVHHLLAAAAEDGKMRVWDISNPRKPDGIEIKHAHGNEDQSVSAVAFSPDGEWLASGGGDQQVVLWKVVSDGDGPPKIEATPGTLFLTQTVFSLAFSGNSETLAVGDGSGLTCLYRVETRDKVGTCLIGHPVSSSGGINAVAFAKGGAAGPQLLTAGIGQPIVAWDDVLWDFRDDDETDSEMTRDVCRLAGRNLSEDEWTAIFSSTTIAGDREKTCDAYPLPDE